MGPGPVRKVCCLRTEPPLLAVTISRLQQPRLSGRQTWPSFWPWSKEPVLGSEGPSSRSRKRRSRDADWAVPGCLICCLFGRLQLLPIAGGLFASATCCQQHLLPRQTHRFDLLLLPILLDLPSHFLVGLFLQQPPLQQQQEQRNRNAIKMRLQSAAEFLTRTHQRSENVAAIYIPGQIFRK